MYVPYQKNISQIIHQSFGRVLITRLKVMARKGLMEDIPKHLPDLEDPYLICLLTKATKFPIFLTIDVSKFAPGFMIQMGFSFFNV